MILLLNLIRFGVTATCHFRDLLLLLNHRLNERRMLHVTERAMFRECTQRFPSTSASTCISFSPTQPSAKLNNASGSSDLNEDGLPFANQPLSLRTVKRVPPHPPLTRFSPNDRDLFWGKLASYAVENNHMPM